MRISMTQNNRGKRRMWFALLLVMLLCVPFAYAALSDYVQPLKGLNIPLGEVLAVHQRDLYNEKVIQFSKIYYDGWKLARRTTPRAGSSTFSDDIKQKVADYEDAIKIFDNIVSLTRNELDDSRMRTFHDDAQNAANSLRSQLAQLREDLRDDDSDCIGTELACNPDGHSSDYCTGFWENAAWGIWGGECDYDNGEYQPSIETENVDELREEAKGLTPWYKKVSWYWWAIIIIVLLFLVGTFLRRRGWLGPLGYAVGLGLRGAAILLTGALMILLRMLRWLVRYIRRRFAGPGGAPAPAPGGAGGGGAPGGPAPGPAPGPAAGGGAGGGGPAGGGAGGGGAGGGAPGI
ncbi:MAG: hypothetical protein KJ574_01385 [Nanoarchaeota archaeon]|nr:hypothetical protein [Nanoarchaeota archaeon]